MQGALSQTDAVVVGGGIVGLATAWRLAEIEPGWRIALLEKELRVAAHQSGRNSGVLHSGVYYRPGSLKAALCRQGKADLEVWCAAEGLPVVRCGKVILATTRAEEGRLLGLAERARANQVESELLGPEGLRALEPHAAARAALYVPGTGITDFARICERLAARLVARGHEVRTGVMVRSFDNTRGGVRVATSAGPWGARVAVNCAGLQADRLAGGAAEVRIIPFRGEFHWLTRAHSDLIRGLVYPTPDPALPFLGVHFTRTLDGRVKCGPNAVLAGAREGYGREKVGWRDAWATASWPGFWRMAARHGGHGLRELHRSVSVGAFAAALRRLLPEVRASMLEPGPRGVRAQAVGRDGALLDDFCVVEEGRTLHLLNAPSPAATAALAIGGTLAERVRRLA